MAENPTPPSSEPPLGTEQPRARWPVYAWAAALILWCAFLLWLVLTYPARS